MNALDIKISEMFSVVAYKNNWKPTETFDKYVAIRNLIDQGANSRSQIISLLRKAGA